MKLLWDIILVYGFVNVAVLVVGIRVHLDRRKKQLEEGSVTDRMQIKDRELEKHSPAY
jgi:hypothetical protein